MAILYLNVNVTLTEGTEKDVADEDVTKIILLVAGPVDGCVGTSRECLSEEGVVRLLNNLLAR